MKCIKHILSDDVRRVSEAEAEAIRAADTLEPKCWQYCPKRVWRAAIRATSHRS